MYIEQHEEHRKVENIHMFNLHCKRYLGLSDSADREYIA
jgi:hypothetical protein